MSRIRNEWIYFWTSLMFFTRIPVPFRLPYSTDIMNRSQRYYAWTGLVVGLCYAFVYYVTRLLFGDTIALVLATGAGVLLTGAFHEDGFADVCDAFGGGYGKEKILTIMKDSRIGAYGTIGIILILLLKLTVLDTFAGLSSVSMVCFLFIFAHSASRFVAALTIYTHAYVRDTDTSKSKPVADKALPLSSLLVGITALLIPVVTWSAWVYLLTLVPALVAQWGLAAYFKKHIGGYTGDCLGAIQQVSEVAIYLSAVLLWKYI